MSAIAAQIAKASAEGKELLQARKYTEAVEKLTEAIDAAEQKPRRPRHLGGRKDEDEMLLMLSNRSAANRGAGSYTTAIADANRCIGLGNDNHRGYWRLAVALRCDGQWTEAVQALEDGIASVTDEEGLQRLRDTLTETRRLEHEEKHRPPPSARPPPQEDGPPEDADFVSGTSASVMTLHSSRGAILCLLRTAILFATVMFAIANTVGPSQVGRGSWRLVLLGSFFSHVGHLFTVLGPPRRGVAYPARMLSSFEFTRILMCFPVLLFAHPVALALFPVVGIEAVRITDHLRVLSPGLHKLAILSCGPTANLLFGSGCTARTAELKIMQWTPFVEIASACLMTLLLISSPSPFSTFGYWMLLQVRHMIESASSRVLPPGSYQETFVRDAWESLDTRAERLLGSVPLVGGLYRTVRSFAKRQVKLPEKGQKATTRCS
eukprot:Hpha_TRINITY_DN24794_c0_g1::TRINITY_DN24794_c0_g1_i1::g.110238::m.110238